MNNELVLDEKKQFIEEIKRWVILDSQLKIVNEKTKKMREMKSDLSEKICKYSDDNNISNNKIKITDGELRFYEKKEYTPLTFGYIEKSLTDIVKDKEQVEYIIQYLKQNREVKSSQDIRRTYYKPMNR
jgi:hypothetical protein